MAVPKILVMMLLKNPESYDKDGNVFPPDPRWLEWHPTPLVENPEECEHTETCCSECTDSWAEDYYIRIYTLEKFWDNDPDAEART